MSDPTPGDRQLAAWDAQHAEIERALGLPGAPRPVTPEVRLIAAALERVQDGTSIERTAAPAAALTTSEEI